MGMGDVKFSGEAYTWANNREGEGFIQERLDRFCGSPDWMLQRETAEVTHFLRQTSDHSLIVLDSKPRRKKTQARFIFEASWIKEQGCEERVKGIWQRSVIGSRMFKVQQKLKWCKSSFIKWRKERTCNARKEIDIIQKEMESLQMKEEERDGKRWR